MARDQAGKPDLHFFSRPLKVSSSGHLYFHIKNMSDYLVRYGVIPEVARCRGLVDVEMSRGDRVVVETHRGSQVGVIVDTLRVTAEPKQVSADAVDEEPSFFNILRAANDDDEAKFASLEMQADAAWDDWQRRIEEWNIDLQMIDLEWTLDGEKLVIYVLNDRGNECAKLALHAATEGLGIIEVQPVSEEGVVPQPASNTGGGCGSGGCGCH
ncbi:MAG: hypothetical protein R3C01_03625 [Planctomycetaceae bacterium]